MKITLVIGVLLLPFLSFTQNNICDESYKDESFMEFKTKLAYSVLKKDNTLLRELLYDKVEDCWDGYGCAGFEGCEKDQFIRFFFNDSTSAHWQTMKQLIRYGFAKNIDTTKEVFIKHEKDSVVFRAPSYNVKQGNLLILGENVNIREQANTTSRILKKISFETYPYEMEEHGFPNWYKAEWIKLKFDDGTSGFVFGKYTSEGLDRILRVGKIEGQWKIIGYHCQLDI